MELDEDRASSSDDHPAPHTSGGNFDTVPAQISKKSSLDGDPQCKDPNEPLSNLSKTRDIENLRDPSFSSTPFRNGNSTPELVEPEDTTKGDVVIPVPKQKNQPSIKSGSKPTEDNIHSEAELGGVKRCLPTSGSDPISINEKKSRVVSPQKDCGSSSMISEPNSNIISPRNLSKVRNKEVRQRSAQACHFRDASTSSLASLEGDALVKARSMRRSLIESQPGAVSVDRKESYNQALSSFKKNCESISLLNELNSDSPKQSLRVENKNSGSPPTPPYARDTALWASRQSKRSMGSLETASLASMEGDVLTKLVNRSKRSTGSLKPGAVSVDNRESFNQPLTPYKNSEFPSISEHNTDGDNLRGTMKLRGKQPSVASISSVASHDSNLASMEGDVLAKLVNRSKRSMGSLKPGAVSVDDRELFNQPLTPYKNSEFPSINEHNTDGDNLRGTMKLRGKQPSVASISSNVSVESDLASMEAIVLANVMARKMKNSLLKSSIVSTEGEELHSPFSSTNKNNEFPMTSSVVTQDVSPNGSPTVEDKSRRHSTSSFASHISEHSELASLEGTIHAMAQRTKQTEMESLRKSSPARVYRDFDMASVEGAIASDALAQGILSHESRQEADSNTEMRVEPVVNSVNQHRLSSTSVKSLSEDDEEQVPAGDDGLAVAIPVSDDQEQYETAFAQEYDPKYRQAMYKKRSFMICGFCFVSAIIIVIVVSLHFTREAIELIETKPTDSPTPSPTSTRAYEISKKVLAISPEAADKNTNNFRAMNWIIREDKRQVDPSHPLLLQRYALALLYFSTSGDSWVQCGYSETVQNCTNQWDEYMFYVGSEFLGGTHECEWFGIYCTDDLNVQEIYLVDNNLRGTVPYEVSELPFLVRFSINANNITGTIPSKLGRLKYLEDLEFHMNSMTGSIPEEIYNLDTLWRLDLSENKLTGTISNRIGELTDLEYMWLSWNKLTGSIPEEVGNATKLEVLMVDGNGLNGTIPTVVGNLARLAELNIGFNTLVGTIPSELGKLRQLQFISLQENNFNGVLPEDIFNLTNLQIFYAYSNFLSGTLSEKIGNLDNLVQLVIRKNKFEGTIPSSLGNLKNLAVLLLHYNKFTGVVPDSVCDLTQNFELGYLGTDCLDDYNDKLVECKCCTICCDEMQNLCIEPVN